MGSIFTIKQKNRQKKPFFAVCKNQSTRQRMAMGLAGKHLCCVLNPGHTAKDPFFAVCWHTAKASSHRQLSSSPFFLPSVEYCTRLCRCMVAVGLLPCATHGKAFAVCKPGFAVCFRHTANSLCPVVQALLPWLTPLITLLHARHISLHAEHH